MTITMTVTSVCSLVEGSGARSVCTSVSSRREEGEASKNLEAHAFLRSSLFREKIT